jgi:hypothetical protein
MQAISHPPTKCHRAAKNSQHSGVTVRVTMRRIPAALTAVAAIAISTPRPPSCAAAGWLRTNEEGLTSVYKSGPTFELVAQNALDRRK